MEGVEETPPPAPAPPVPPLEWLRELRGRWGGGLEREAREGVLPPVDGEGGNSNCKRVKDGEDRPNGGLESGEENGEGDGEVRRGESRGEAGILDRRRCGFRATG